MKSTSTTTKPRRKRIRNPLFTPQLGAPPFVRTNRAASEPLFPGAPIAKKTRARNPLIVSPSYMKPELDDEQRVVGEASNPSPWERSFMQALETMAGSLGGFGWNLLAGSTVRSMAIESQTANDALGYLAAAAPALAFATFLRGDETWKAAFAGASLYDFWAQLAHKAGLGQVEPRPPSSP